MPDGELEGRTVLVLEDEPIIAIDLQMECEDAGATVLRAETVAEARAALEAGVDTAVLDYTLMSRTTAEPIADALMEAGIPFVFYSGDLDRHGEAISRFGVPILNKPVPARDVVRALVEGLEACRTSGADA